MGFPSLKHWEQGYLGFPQTAFQNFCGKKGKHLRRYFLFWLGAKGLEQDVIWHVVQW